MKAAIFYSGKFGSTKKYAFWINERTYLPVFDLAMERPDPSEYDLLILGSSIIAMKPTIQKWLKANWSKIKNKPVLLFTVSGTEPGHPDLKKWLVNSLSEALLSQVYHVPLRGRLILDKLPWSVRLIMKFAARVEKDPDTKKRMEEGFDYMDKSSIEPILKWVTDTVDKEHLKLSEPQVVW